ncbi:MAG: hypothetical protein H7246_15380, partial [Phycisphaerae bacterium]|nr:hypothetical protein [Saprospiraceae bacterium]
MKFHALLSITLLFTLAIISSCKNDSGASKDATLQSEDALNKATAPGAETAPSANPATAEPPQNAAGVWHYTCPKGCAGGAGSAIACATCGTTLTHNQGYHGPAVPPTTTDPSSAPDQAPGTPPGAKQPEPPQNAAGVWHYTCPSGCAGGAG